MAALSDIQLILPEPFARALDMLSAADRASVCELRMRSHRPYAAMLGARPVFFTDASVLSVPTERCLAPAPKDVANTLARCSEYSLHKSGAQLSEGYLTMRGAHRVGVCASRGAQGAVDPATAHSLNIRVAGEVLGCADELVRATQGEGLASVLLAGAPLSGKTTLLRDFARTLSSAPSLHKTVIADERSELAALHEGESPLTLGAFCDVVDGVDKRAAFNIALRALSPEMIVFDEIGEESDFETLTSAAARGMKLASSVHASSGERSRVVERLLATGAFDYLATLRDGALGVLENVERISK